MRKGIVNGLKKNSSFANKITNLWGKTAGFAPLRTQKGKNRIFPPDKDKETDKDIVIEKDRETETIQSGCPAAERRANVEKAVETVGTDVESFAFDRSGGQRAVRRVLLTGIYFCDSIIMLQLEHTKEAREMSSENFTEKVSVNVNTSTLSGIDLLVDNGYYSNRSDFINQALREALQKHQNTLDRIIDKKMSASAESANQWFIGVCNIGKQEVEQAKSQGTEMEIKGYGVLVVDKDIDEQSLYQTVRSIKVKGKVVCAKSIKEHYGLK